MSLTQTQKIVIKDNHRFRVLRCGRRWGKTTLACKEIKGLSISREAKIGYIANNYQQARDIMWEMLKKELRPAIIDTNESRLEVKVKTRSGGQSLIILRGWESIENLRGQAFDFLILDEVAQMRNFWSNWQEVLRPTLTDRKGQVLFASTPKGFNFFYDLCNQELTDKTFKSFHFTSYDNPYLPQDEIDTAKQTLPQDRFQQEYMASFQKTHGLVFKEFSRVMKLNGLIVITTIHPDADFSQYKLVHRERFELMRYNINLQHPFWEIKKNLEESGFSIQEKKEILITREMEKYYTAESFQRIINSPFLLILSAKKIVVP